MCVQFRAPTSPLFFRCIAFFCFSNLVGYDLNVVTQTYTQFNYISSNEYKDCHIPMYLVSCLVAPAEVGVLPRTPRSSPNMLLPLMDKNLLHEGFVARKHGTRSSVVCALVEYGECLFV